LQGLTTLVQNKTTEPVQIGIHAEVVESGDSDSERGTKIICNCFTK